MKQKVFSLLSVTIFFALCSYLFGYEYWEFQQTKSDVVTYETYVQNSLENYELEDITDTQDYRLHITPDRDLLDQIVSKIDSAETRIFLEAYIFTERDIKDAIIEAHKRGVDVKVLLENNPYKAPYLNDNHFNDLEEAGVDIRWSDPLNYSLNHSKLLIIDSAAYISTGNFSYSLFTKNRDFLIELQDPVMLQKLTDLFYNDFQRKKVGVVHPNLVISPEYARPKIEKLIDSSQKTLDMYFPYIADNRLKQKIIGASKKGVKVRLIVEKTFFNEKENESLIAELEEYGISVSPIKKYKLHAKSILSDDRYLYIGSINFSRHSLDENREIGIIIDNINIINEFKDIYEYDF